MPRILVGLWNGIMKASLYILFFRLLVSRDSRLLLLVSFFLVASIIEHKERVFLDDEATLVGSAIVLTAYFSSLLPLIIYGLSYMSYLFFSYVRHKHTDDVIHRTLSLTFAMIPIISYILTRSLLWFYILLVLVRLTLLCECVPAIKPIHLAALTVFFPIYATSGISLSYPLEESLVESIVEQLSNIDPGLVRSLPLLYILIFGYLEEARVSTAIYLFTIPIFIIATYRSPEVLFVFTPLYIVLLLIIATLHRYSRSKRDLFKTYPFIVVTSFQVLFLSIMELPFVFVISYMLPIMLAIFYSINYALIKERSLIITLGEERRVFPYILALKPSIDLLGYFFDLFSLYDNILRKLTVILSFILSSQILVFWILSEFIYLNPLELMILDGFWRFGKSIRRMEPGPGFEPG